MELSSLVRLVAIPVCLLAVGAVPLTSAHAPGRASHDRVGRTAQGQPITLTLQQGTLRAVQTKVRLRCTDGRAWSVAWSVPASGIHAAGGAVTVLQVNDGLHLTARLDGHLAGAPHGVLRAIGARDGIRCDSGSVSWSA